MSNLLVSNVLKNIADNIRNKVRPAIATLEGSTSPGTRHIIEKTWESACDGIEKSIREEEQDYRKEAPEATVHVLAVLDRNLQMTGVGWYTYSPLDMTWNRKVGTLVELFRVTDSTIEKARDQALLIYPQITTPEMLAKFPLKP